MSSMSMRTSSLGVRLTSSAIGASTGMSRTPSCYGPQNQTTSRSSSRSSLGHAQSPRTTQSSHPWGLAMTQPTNKPKSQTPRHLPGLLQQIYGHAEQKPTHTATLSSSRGRARGAAGGGLGATGTCVLLGPVGLLVVGVAVEVLQRADGALPHHGPAAEGPVVNDFDDDGGAVQALAGQTLRVERGGNTSLHTAPTPKLPEGRRG